MNVAFRPPAIFAASAWVFVLLLHVAAVAAADDPFRDFDAYATAAMKDWHAPAMAVSVVKDGRVVLARGYGIRKMGTRAAVDADTVFPIASSTKAFNATALAILVDEGRLRWTDRVVTHLPEFQLHDPWMTREVNIADLLAHRTGLADSDHFYSDFTRAELIRRMRFVPQVSPFRVGVRYNNMGTILAGEILERISGKSWSEFVRERVLKPLEMTATVPDVLELAGVENVATPYVDVDGRLLVDSPLQEDRTWALPLTASARRYREAIRPAGAICSSANDLAKFAIFQLAEGEFHGRRLVSAETIRQMQALHSVDPITNVPEPPIAPCKVALGAGFGWLIRDYHGRKLVSHAGSTGAIIALVPEEKLGVVVLTNLATGVHSMVMYDLLDRMLGMPRAWTNREFIEAVLDEYEKPRDAEYARLDRDRRAHMKPHGPLSQYTGTYASDFVGQLIVKEVNGSLQFQLGPNGHAALEHWSGDRFRTQFVLRFPEDWFFSFVRDKDRVVKVMIANVFPSSDVGTFTRVD
jgi:CubicO group peptidase (beta-lactamase class C family)